MHNTTETPAPGAGLGIFERWLTLWVAAAILVGTALGRLLPDLFALIARLEYASVNIVVGVLIWVMIFPMMVGVDFSSFGRIRRQPRGLIITLAVNWLIKPFTMAALGLLFFRGLYAGLFTASEADSYIAGLVLLGAAPCTAMVFVWSHLTRGDPTYTLVQVTLNDTVLIFAYAPIVALLLGLTDINVPWATLVLSVVLYVVIPLGAGIYTRHRLLGQGGEAMVEAFRDRIKPWAAAGLVAMVALLFGFQGDVIVNRPVVIALIAVPLLIQSYGIFFCPGAGHGCGNCRMKSRHPVP